MGLLPGVAAFLLLFAFNGLALGVFAFSLLAAPIRFLLALREFNTQTKLVAEVRSSTYHRSRFVGDGSLGGEEGGRCGGGSRARPASWVARPRHATTRQSTWPRGVCSSCKRRHRTSG